MDQILSIYNSVQHNLNSNPNITIDIIKRSISHPDLYHFGEIRDLLVAKLKYESLASEVQQWMNTLEIFTYGNWNDYRQAESVVPLDDSQTKKLKQLSLASIASHSRNINYSLIASILEIDQSQLEPFLVDSIYAGLISGKLDTKRQMVEINNVFGRDVSQQRLEEISNNLNDWVARTESILEDTNSYIYQYRSQAEKRKQEVEEYNEQVKKINEELAHCTKSPLAQSGHIDEDDERIAVN